jgi:hypothetical protein
VTIFLVERYLADVHPEVLSSLPQRLGAATAQLRAQGTPIRHVDSTFLPDEECCFCRFEALSAEAVALANEIADAPYSRISPGVMLTAEAAPGTDGVS